MRNLDNQMMLYFSDKSLIFKLYYYILVNTRKKKRKTSNYTLKRITRTLEHTSHTEIPRKIATQGEICWFKSSVKAGEIFQQIFLSAQQTDTRKHLHK